MSVLQDKADIIDIINLYGVALDAHAWDLLDEVFTTDAHADFGPAGAVWKSVGALKFAFKDFHETLTNHMHAMTGSCVHVDGDKANALTYGDWLLSRDSAVGGSDWVGRGWYDDELVRTDKGWRISSRVCRLISWTGNPLVPEPAYEQHPVMTTHTLRSHRDEGKVRFFNAIAGSKLPSTFGALRRPAFRMLWLVWMGANLTMWLNDVASAWLMTSLTDSALMIAMVQSASTLPLFLLGLPSGALADLVDRRRYLALTQIWVGVVAIALAALSYSGRLNAPLLLVCTFLNGLGMAMRWPLFAAIVPELVPRGELPAALALNGIAANLSRIIGPMLAGALLAGTGGLGVYLLNAALSMVALALILCWRPPPKNSVVAAEGLWSAMRAGLRHVAHSPPLRIILLRIFLFFLQATALTALLPLLALRLGDAQAGSPGAYTLLLVALATGGIAIAFNLNRLRRHASANTMVAAGVCVHAAASTCAALAPTLWLAAPAVAVAGMAWLATANSLTVAVQLALPDRVRARGMAIYHMAVMGGSAVGAALWGTVASVGSVRTSMMLAAALGPLLLLLTRRHRVGGTAGDAENAIARPMALRQRRLACHIGNDLPVIRRFIG